MTKIWIFGPLPLFAMEFVRFFNRKVTRCRVFDNVEGIQKVFRILYFINLKIRKFNESVGKERELKPTKTSSIEEQFKFIPCSNSSPHNTKKTSVPQPEADPSHYHYHLYYLLLINPFQIIHIFYDKYFHIENKEKTQHRNETP